jgi:hypothetical protein
MRLMKRKIAYAVEGENELVDFLDDVSKKVKPQELKITGRPGKIEVTITGTRTQIKQSLSQMELSLSLAQQGKLAPKSIYSASDLTALQRQAGWSVSQELLETGLKAKGFSAEQGEHGLRTNASREELLELIRYTKKVHELYKFERSDALKRFIAVSGYSLSHSPEEIVQLAKVARIISLGKDDQLSLTLEWHQAVSQIQSLGDIEDESETSEED